MNDIPFGRLLFGTHRKPIDKAAFRDLFETHVPVILDIGCYDGRDSLAFLEIFPAASIYAFEADRRSIDLFRRVTQTASNEKGITLVPNAVGDMDGQVTWHPSDSGIRRHYDFQASWSASSSLKLPRRHLSVFPDVTFLQTESVPCTRLDTWIDEHLGWNRNIDLVWVDVNGGAGKYRMKE